MKKLWLIRKDHEAVSPVIATILMVAITVVLAAVLYVMVSGLLTGPGGGPRSLGVNVEKSGDGTQWVLTLANVPSGLTTTGTTLAVFKADGSVNLSATFLSAVSTATGGCIQFSGDGDTSVEVGERILMKSSVYPSGVKVQIADGVGILFSSTITG